MLQREQCFMPLWAFVNLLMPRQIDLGKENAFSSHFSAMKEAIEIVLYRNSLIARKVRSQLRQYGEEFEAPKKKITKHNACTLK